MHSVDIVVLLIMVRYKMLIVSVLGALIGKQKGRNLEIMNSFELMFHVIDSTIIVDREYYTTKEDQCQ